MLLQHNHLFAQLRQQRRTGQTTNSRANHDNIVIIGNALRAITLTNPQLASTDFWLIYFRRFRVPSVGSGGWLGHTQPLLL